LPGPRLQTSVGFPRTRRTWTIIYIYTCAPDARAKIRGLFGKSPSNQRGAAAVSLKRTEKFSLKRRPVGLKENVLAPVRELIEWSRSRSPSQRVLIMTFFPAYSAARTIEQFRSRRPLFPDGRKQSTGRHDAKRRSTTETYASSSPSGPARRTTVQK